jgi:hypothetical protein
MFDDITTLCVVVVLVVLGGSLFYIPPPSPALARLRMAVLIVMACFVPMLFTHAAFVDSKQGGFVVLVLPGEFEVCLPHPYDYYVFYKTLPLIQVTLHFLAVVGPVFYLLKRRLTNQGGH